MIEKHCRGRCLQRPVATCRFAVRGVEGAAPYDFVYENPFAWIAKTQPKAVSSRAQSRDLIDASCAKFGRSLGKLGMTSLCDGLRGVEGAAPYDFVYENPFASANTFILHFAFCILHFERSLDKPEFVMLLKIFNLGADKWGKLCYNILYDTIPLRK